MTSANQIDSSKRAQGSRQDPVTIKYEDGPTNELFDIERQRLNLLAKLRGTQEFTNNRRKVQIKTKKDLED